MYICAFVCVHTCVYVCLYICMDMYSYICMNTGWRRLIGSPKLQIIFHKRATKYRSLLQKMTYKDKGSYEFSPPCTYSSSPKVVPSLLFSCYDILLCIMCIGMCVYVCVCMFVYMYGYVFVYMYAYGVATTCRLLKIIDLFCRI